MGIISLVFMLSNFIPLCVKGQDHTDISSFIPQIYKSSEPSPICENDTNSFSHIGRVEKFVRDRVRISTNLPYWAALAPNGGLEIEINDRNNLSISYSGAWWSHLRHQKVYRIIIGELGWQHYLAPQCGGHNIGWYGSVYANVGLYEIMFSPIDKKGEYWGGAATWGYRWQISKKFSISAEAGIGSCYTKYRYARYQDEDLILKGRIRKWCVFPRVGVNLVYYFKQPRL